MAPSPATRLSVNNATDLPMASPYHLGGSFPTPGPSSLRHALTQTVPARDGNIDPLSIAYVFRPRLRPASPAVDQHRCGTLGHSVGKILTPLALLMPTFALVAAPGLVPRPLLC